MSNKELFYYQVNSISQYYLQLLLNGILLFAEWFTKGNTIKIHYYKSKTPK